MHRHASLFPIVRSQHSTRPASTAAKLKPREWAASPYTPNRTAPSRPLDDSVPRHEPWSTASSTTPPSHRSNSQIASKKFKPLRQPPAPNSLNKWTRSSTPSSFSPHTQTQSLSKSVSRLQPNKENSNEFRDKPDHQPTHGSHMSISTGTHRSKTKFGWPDLPSNSSSQKIEAQPPNNEPTELEEVTYVDDFLPDNSEAVTRSGRQRKDMYKDRGSLLVDRSREAIRPVQQSRPAPSVKLKPQKPVKPKSHVQLRRRRPDVYIPSTVSVGTLSRLLKVKTEYLKHKIELTGITDQASYDYVLTAEYAALLAEEFGRHPIIDDEAAFDLFPPGTHPNPSCLPSRPPVVTIMGHVDHGKTTLLDTLRSASVAKCEPGGITQHIGAFTVPVKQSDSGQSGAPQSITFLDTPGHAAFSAMRARGAGVTDIIVLVVAADDGIMPQTKEVIDLYKKDESKIGLVVAINKVDKPDADVDSIERALLVEGIQLEAYGGDIPAVRVSGLTGQGLPELVETLSLLAEMQDLRAEREGQAYGQILESQVQRGLGFVGTVLVRRGSLKTGSHILSGLSYAKVRRMSDSNGVVVKTASPGMAVTVSGWKTLPKAGDEVLEGSDADIKKALTNRIRKAEIEASLADVDAINESRRHDREQRIAGGQPNVEDTEELKVAADPKELRLIIKADVSGSAEAVEGALEGIGNKIAKSKIISSGVGDISESDVMMAKALDATIVGFSVSVSRSVQNLAVQNSVPICTSSIIYRIMEDVRQRVRSLLPIITETKVTGEATILQLFDIHLKDKVVKKVAGCRVTNGLVEKSKFARVVRNGSTIHEGMLDTMRQLKKDVTEVRKGTECGLSFACFSDILEGDLIQMYEKIEKPGVL